MLTCFTYLLVKKAVLAMGLTSSLTYVQAIPSPLDCTIFLTSDNSERMISDACFNLVGGSPKNEYIIQSEYTVSPSQKYSSIFAPSGRQISCLWKALNNTKLILKFAHSEKAAKFEKNLQL